MSDRLSVSELEKRMRPGAYSTGGFLGHTESLAAVIAHDRQTLSVLGVSYEQIAQALERLLRGAHDQRAKLLKSNYQEYSRRDTSGYIPNLYRPPPGPYFTIDNLPSTDIGYLVGSKFQVFIAQYRGIQECPWECELIGWSSFDFLILNRQSGRYVTGPGLIVHLIRNHHFFEGLESPYRVDPAVVVEVLEIPSAADLG